MNENNRYKYSPLPEPIPITEQKWPKDYNPLVHTRTMTFMHEKYIRDCIEGILMQKTTFPVQVLIHDDASTDKTSEIIREYENKCPSLIKVFYQKENSFTKADKHERRKEFMSWRTGKYEATCEGDDYWIDPLKLQKQVDFLEAHPDYSFSHTGYKNYIEQYDKYFINDKQTHFNNSFKDKSSDLIAEYILNNNKYRICVPTVLLRCNLMNQLLLTDEFLYKSGYFKMGDTQRWIGLLKYGKVHYLSDITSVYRTHFGSASRQKSIKSRKRFTLSVSEMKLYLARKNKHPQEVINMFEAEFKKNLWRYLIWDHLFESKIEIESKNGFDYMLMTYIKTYGIVRMIFKTYDFLREKIRILHLFLPKKIRLFRYKLSNSF